MAKLTRITGKVFGSNATATVGGIGQFGSAITGTPNLTTDVATIQALPAYLNGWGSAVITSRNFPPIEEVTGVLKTISYQACYTLQEGIPEYDINTEYSNTSLVKSVNNGIVTIYASLQNNNIGNSLSNGAYWKPYILDRIQRNIGEIVQSVIPLSDAGLHLLDGSLLNGSGSYGAFVTYIANLYTADPTANYFCSEADWQTSVTTYGVCGKFVYDSVNNTVRLPKYSNKIYTSNNTTVPVKGNGMTLGITNGTQNFGMHTYSAGVIGGLEGLYGQNVGSSVSTGSHISGNALGVTTDGTKSGLIADLANITTSLEGYYYIVVATSIKTNIQVDIDEIATDLNGKADVDLSNCTKPHIVSTYVNGTSWYRVYSDGFCVQGGVATTTSEVSSITLLKEYVDTNYTIIATSRHNTSTAGGVSGISSYDITTTGFKLYIYQDAAAHPRCWVTYGYIS